MDALWIWETIKRLTNKSSLVDKVYKYILNHGKDRVYRLKYLIKIVRYLNKAVM